MVGRRAGKVEVSSVAGRNTIAGTRTNGIVARVDGKEIFYTWREIECAHATYVPYNGGSVFVVSIGVTKGRLLLLSEIEPAWVDVVEALHLRLPDVEPFTRWGPMLVADPGVCKLYDADFHDPKRR